MHRIQVGLGPDKATTSEPARSDASEPPLATFFDLGANMEDGLPYQDWARALRDQRVADGMKDNPDANCLPMGHMQLHLHPQPRKIVQLPELIVMLIGTSLSKSRVPLPKSSG